MNRIKRAHGFTLMELMITIAIIGILSTLAVPYYGDYIRKSRLPEAFAALEDGAFRLNQYLTNNQIRTYNAVVTNEECGITTFSTPKNFTVTCKILGDKGLEYKLTATGNGAQMGGFVFTLNQKGERITVDLPEKWKNGVTVPINCWVNGNGGRCNE